MRRLLAIAVELEFDDSLGDDVVIVDKAVGGEVGGILDAIRETGGSAP